MDQVNAFEKEIAVSSYPIDYIESDISSTNHYKPSAVVDNNLFLRWKKVNVFPQKQKGLVAVGLCIKTGDISTTTARLLADVVENFCGEDARFTINQGILLRSVDEGNLEALFEALSKIGLDRIGFDRLNDIVACPGTDTCNLGIASSMGLAKELQSVIENEFVHIIDNHQISIKISGCMNACGQHTLADIGFQGMTLKSNGNIAPATQVLLGGGIVGDGNGLFADKLLKVPSKRTPDVLRWILIDFENNHNEESFLKYYKRKGSDYFYQNLKHFSETSDLKTSDFIDWGNDLQYEKAIGIGECAGVTIDLVQTLLFDAEEYLENAEKALDNEQISNSIYFNYSSQIRAAKALLTTVQARINSHDSIIHALDEHFPDFEKDHGFTFVNGVKKIALEHQNVSYAKEYALQARTILNWIKGKAGAR